MSKVSTSARPGMRPQASTKAAIELIRMPPQTVITKMIIELIK